MTTNWLNLNNQRSYPLVDLGTADERYLRAVVDAGFMLGIDNYFQAAYDKVVLWRMTKTATSIRYLFRALYADTGLLSCHEWDFTFDLTAAFGTTNYTDAYDTDTLVENPDWGTAFLTIGDLEQVSALPDLDIAYSPELEVEPATLQVLRRSFVRSINLANRLRLCPDESDPDIPDSSSSSSSTSSESGSIVPPVCEDVQEDDPEADAIDIRTVYPTKRGMTGEIAFKPGYNATIRTLENLNQLLFGASDGAGEGQICTDLRINLNGIREDVCQSCGDLVYMINGAGLESDQLQLVGGPGVVIEPKPAENRIVITIEENLDVCDVGF